MSRDRLESSKFANHNLKQLESFLSLVKGGSLAINGEALDIFLVAHGLTGSADAGTPPPSRNRKYGSYAATSPESTANIKKRAWEHTYKHYLEDDAADTHVARDQEHEHGSSHSRQISGSSASSSSGMSDIAVFDVDSRPSSVYSMESDARDSFSSPFSSPFDFPLDDFDSPMTGYGYLPTW